MRKELIAYRDPKSPTSEMFRNLRTNIQFMASNKQIKTILITSTLPGEGKSWISSNLAVTFAQAGRSVIVVDSDMRKGRVHTIFGTEKKPGLSNYLSGIDESGKITDYNISSYLKTTEIENLFVLPAGNIPPNPSELLVSHKAKEMMNELKAIADIIIFDGTPSLLVTDAIILSRYVDTTIIVTAHKETKVENLQKVKKNIKNVGGRIAGVVINKIPMSARNKEQYYYYGNSNDNLLPAKEFKIPRGNRTISKSQKETEQLEEIRRNKARVETMIKQNTKRDETRYDVYEPKRMKQENYKKNNIENVHKNNREKIVNKVETKPVSTSVPAQNIEATIDTTSDILEQLNKYLDKEKSNIRSDKKNW